MLVQRGGGLGRLGDSITVTADAVPVEYAPVDIEVPSELTYSGLDQNTTLDLTGMFPWLGSGSSAPLPSWLPGSQAVVNAGGGSGAQTANALTNLAASVANIFRPGAASATRPGAPASSAASRPAAPGAASWFSQNMGLVIGGVAVVLILPAILGRRR